MNSKRERILRRLLSDESFQAWLAGSASAAENKQWQQWLESSIENRELFTEALEIWKSAQFKKSPLPDVNAEWENMQKRLKFAGEPETPRSYGRLPLNREFSALHRWMGWSAAVAAVLALIFFVWSGNFITRSKTPDYKIVKTAYGEQLQIQLPDQSTVILNANSELAYSQNWNAQTPRAVKLRGEAYFQVTSQSGGARAKFVVNTEDGSVTVRGTHFVVHERGKGTRVTLEEGKVDVNVKSSIAENNNKMIRAHLVPGETVSFHKNDTELLPRPTTESPRVIWWNNDFLLQQTPLRIFIEHLEETYGVSIRVKDGSLMNRVLSGSIENGGIEIVIDALGKVLHVPVTRHGKSVILG